MGKIEGFIRSFCKEMGYADELADKLANDSTLLVAATEYGCIGWRKQGQLAIGQLFYVVPSKRNSREAFKIFKLGHEQAKADGCTKSVVYVKPERLHIYSHRGYITQAFVVEKEL